VHHAALPYGELATFLEALHKQEETAARALHFVILTAGRSGEVLGARWDEIDLDEQVWTVPATRMKAGKEHRVPLSKEALAILRISRRFGKAILYSPVARPDGRSARMR
jgi:integrase